MVRRVNVPSLSWLFCPALCLAVCGISANAQSVQSVLQRPGAGVGFTVAPFIPLSAAATSVASADLNGDGRPDLVVTTHGSNVTVFLSDGNGGFNPGVQYAAGVQPGNALLADLNDDGKVDLVVTDSATGTVNVLFGNGDGTFGKPVAYAAIQNPVGLTLGDFAGKGRIDLAVASSNGLAVLLNDGSGHFPAAKPVAISSQPVSLAAADLTGSGHDDLVLANQNGTVSVLLGDGNGGFHAPVATSVASGPLSSVVSGDFNGDGKADIAVTQANSNSLTVLLSRGDGAFQPGLTYTVGNSPGFVLSADLKGNGIADLITINRAANTFSVLAGNGDGTFQPAQDFVAGGSPLAAVAGDFSGDGHTDLAIVNSGDGTISVPMGRGDGTFAAARAYRAGLENKAIVAGDLNGDGFQDLVVVNSCGSDPACSSLGSATVFLANPDGTYRAASTIPLGNGPVAVALADLNGNKKPDLLAVNRNDRSLMVFPGNGNGTFGKAQTYSLAESPRALYVGDFNNDGIPDVAIAMDCGQETCAQAGNVDIWLGKNDGTLAEANTYAAGFSPISIAVGDLRGTGNLDLVVANACGSDSSCKSDGSATLLAGDGKGNFAPLGQIDIGKSPSAIVLGDLSGSGLDLAVAQRASNQVAVMSSNGSGGFNAPAVYPVGSAPSSLAIADFNGDGYQDLAVANFQSSTVSVLYGTATGTLQPAVNYAVGSGPESLVAVTNGTSSKASLVTANGNTGATPVGNQITALTGITPLALIESTTTLAAPSPTSASVNSTVTLTATVTGTAGAGAPTGSVTFSSNGTNLGDCTGVGVTPGAGATATSTCATQSLLGGTDNLVATYSGDTTYSGSDSTATPQSITVSPLATTTTVALTTGNNPSTVDDTLTFTATVNAPLTTPIAPTGKVAFTDNGTPIASCGGAGGVAVSATDGTAPCTTSTLTAGTHAIIAAYSGDTNFTASNNFVTQTVNSAGGTMTLTSSSTGNSATINAPVTFTVTITPSTGNTNVALSGNVTLTDNGGPVAGCVVTFTPSTGIATCTTSSLALGSHPITATYSGDPSYSFNPAQLTQTITQGSTTTTIGTTNTAPAVNQQVTLTATVTANPTGSTKLSGSVTFTDTPQGGTATTICANVAVSPAAGTATCNDSWPAAGKHTINAAYANDTNFTGSNTNANPVTENVGSANTTLSVSSSVNPSTVNQSPAVIFTATITENPVGSAGLTGTVGFTDTPSGGSAAPIAGCTAVTPSATSSGGVATATCTDAVLTAAGSPHTITATYSGDTNFGGSSNTTSQTVKSGSTSVSLGSSGNPSTVNAPVTFTATITPNPAGSIGLSGNVSFTDTPQGGSAAAITGCAGVALTTSGGVTTAACTTSSLALGSHTITAAYSGDQNFSESSNTYTQTVNAASSSITLTSSSPGNASTVNQTVTFTASIPAPSGSAKLTGQVSFADNSTPIAGCSAVGVTATSSTNYTATCVDGSLTAAGSPHGITASYGGDPNFTVGGGALTQTVSKAGTGTTVSSSQNPSQLNGSVTFTAIVTPSPAGSVPMGGSVTFTDSVTSAAIPGCSGTAVALSGGIEEAVCTTSGLAVSPPAHTITANYSGDSNYNASSGIFVQTVNPSIGTISMSPVSGSTSTVNTSVTFTATIPIAPGLPAPKGILTFTEDNGPITGCPPATPSSNWVGTCTVPSLTAGTHTIVAAYTGDPNVSVNSGSTTLTVSQAVSTTVLTSSLNPSFAFLNNTNNYQDSVTFTASVSAPAGAVVPLSMGTVTFTGNGISTACAGVAVVGGVATCTSTTLPSGTDNIVATYSGDPNYFNSTSVPVAQVVQDYSITVANVPASNQGVLVTQGFTTASDPFPQSQPAAVLPASISGFSSSGITLTCTSATSGAPKCNLAATTLQISGASGAVQASAGIVLDATGGSVTPGTYTFTVTATDPTTSIVRTTTFLATVRPAAVGSNALSLISGATTNNSGSLTFSLPAGVTISNLKCASIVGTGINGAESPSNVGVSCTITPSTLGSATSTSAQLVTASVTVLTNGTIASTGPMDLGNRHPSLLVAGVFGIPLFGLIGVMRRRQMKRTLFSLLAFVALSFAALQGTGCGGSYHSSTTAVTGGTTPPGVYFLLVTGTDQNGNTYSSVLQLNVEL